MNTFIINYLTQRPSFTNLFFSRPSLKRPHWPLDLDYYNPFLPVFLSDVKKGELKKPQRTLFLRDGHIPLNSFFKKHPVPCHHELLLYIHQDCKSHIPQRWVKNVMLYEIVRFSNQKKSIFKNLCIAGISHLEILKSLPFIEKKVDGLQIKGKSRYFYALGSPSLAPIPAESDVHCLNGLDFFSRDILSDSFCINKAPKSFVADDILTHMILSHNGHLQGVRSVKKESCSLILSPYHGMIFHTVAPKGSKRLPRPPSKIKNQD